MVGKRFFEGVDGLGMFDEPCPIVYFPNDETIEARRLTRTKDNEPIFFLDYVLRDETLYALYLEVMPEYRNDEWLQYLDFNKETFEKNYSEFGRYTKTVWVNPVGFSFPSADKVLDKRVKLSQDGLLDQGEIFIQGPIMKYVDTKSPYKK
jgi:hypothetical protein